MNEKIIKDLCMTKEIRCGIHLIKKGLAELNSISFSNDFYYAIFLLLAYGFEKFMKCILCLIYFCENGTYPNIGFIPKGTGGHNLSFLLSRIIKYCKKTNYIKRSEACKSDIGYLINDAKLKKLIGLLSDFGQSERYYNLNVILDNKSNFKSPEDVYQKIEQEIVLENPLLKNQYLDPNSNNEIYSEINKIILVKLERFTRALCRIFTLGKIANEGKKYTFEIGDFLYLMDADLGKLEYLKRDKN